MRHLARIIWLLGLVAAAAPREIPPPIAPPYDDSRTLLASEFVRLDWKDAARADRVVPVKIYFPTDRDRSFPVIIFSHGLGGTREAYEYLARQWAADGYVVVHPQHAGSDDSTWRGVEPAKRMESLRKAANLENAVARARDVQFVIDRLETLNRDDEKLKGKLDLKRLGVAGHSFGAQTAMLIAGQSIGGPLVKDRLDDSRAIAVIAMSAPTPLMRGKLDQIYAPVKVPVFLMTGTEDNSPFGDTTAAERHLPFEHLSHCPAYLLTLTGGDHMVFSGRAIKRDHDDEFQKLIRLSSTAFWDANLKHDESAKQWLTDVKGFTTLLADNGKFETK